MADSPTLQAATVVLRKRSRAADSGPLVLHLASSPSPSCDPSFTESEFELDSQPRAGPSSIHTASASSKQSKDKRYKCSYDGCTKAYTKPSRLAEHQRSHTGDRPYICSQCQKSFLRDSHLQAHTRAHLPESAKPLGCEEPGCNKRFWTTQHLRVHEKLHQGEKPFKCSEPSCDAAFSKHHQLRDHICEMHAPPGTKPYLCEHTGCPKSFSTNQKLRAHLKTHNDKRYTCVHRACIPAAGGSPTYHPTWSALQHHIRTAHPPMCPHATCNGKTFSTQSNLRAHLKIHAQRDAETELEKMAAGSAEEDEERPMKRRRGGEVGRDWVCEIAGCSKDFKSKKALTTHTNVAHLGRRDFICSEACCGSAFGYKHLLQRHVAKVHRSGSSSGSDSDSCSDSDEAESRHNAGPSTTFSIESLTGNSYATRSQKQLSSTKSLLCPYPSLPPLLFEDTASAASSTNILRGPPCQYVFTRAYDLRRHLRSEHGIDVDKDVVDDWVQDAKKAKAGERPSLHT